ncbi:MAG TPA: PAS domain S-box protein, partial [Gaiellaceae bacterium]|nr:PAS domain S-box protein [Gaiellaceae bacterium]
MAQLALTDIPAQGLLDEACRTVAAELRADLAGVLELLPDLTAFVLRAGVGWPPDQLGVQHVPAGPLSQGGYTLQSGRPVIVRDAASEQRFEISPHMTAQGVTSGLSTSIGSNGGKYGVLGAHTYRRREFSDHDVTFLDAVAGVLASALRRRTAEKEAEEAHRVLEAVIDGTTDSVFVKDIDGRFIIANARAAQVLGRPPAELVGRTFHEVMPGAMADTVTERDRLILERGSVETFEEVVSVGDETRVYLSTKGPYRARDGALLGTFGIVRDITARKAQEQELARSEERFRLAQEGARMGTWDVDLVTGASTWSEGLRKLCGVGPDYPSCFDHLLPLLHPDDREEVARWVEEAYTTGVDVEVECRIVLPDGAVRWLLGRSSTLRSVNGVPTRVLGVALEITKRKRAEEELRAATAYADRLIETSNAIVVVLDADANILTFNKAAEEITGYTRDEVVGRNWDLLSPRDRYPAPWAYHAGLVSDGGPVERYENPILTKSGEERIVLWQNSQLRDQSDEVVGTVSFGIDVTETVAAKEHSQALETRLRHAEKLEAVGQLAGGVAHDFNNVLLAIHGYAELALGRLARGEDGAAGDIEEVLASAERAAALTSQLLAFGRRQVLNPEVLDLNEVVRNVHGLLARVIGDNVELVTELAQRPVVVKADRGQLEQVIANLAVNGRDAMPGGGRLTIRVASAELERGDADGASRQALLSVIDEGSGIDAATALLIFEPFFTT